MYIRVVRSGFLLALLFTFYGRASAQKLSILPNDSVYVQSGLEDLQMPVIYQFNYTTDTVIIGWKKVYAAVPAQWEAAVCDNKICYADLTDSGYMAPVPPATSGFLSMHLTGHQAAGRAVIRYEVWDKKDPGNRDTLTYIMDIFGAKTAEINEFSKGIFPIPVTDRIFCRPGMEFISLENIMGRNILRFEAGSNSADLTGIPCGTYLIRYKMNETIRFEKIIKN